MRVKEFLLKNELKKSIERLRKLEEMKAPKVMIEAQEKAIMLLKEGTFLIGGDKELLDTEFESFEVKRGNGGKVYIEFDTGVKYFPQARYGRFITR